jgi:hypothetical protein
MNDRTRSRSLTRLSSTLAVLLGLGLTLGPRPADAAPGVNVGGRVGTQGAQGNASTTGKKKPYKLPERIAQGNAITALLPVQVGFVGYLPRVRIGFQYERQLYKSHWAYIGVAGLFDRAGWDNFRLAKCGLETVPGACGRGTVAGFDVYAGYAHKWFLKDRPYLVPIARGGLGGGWWKYPDITGSRQQTRESSWMLSLRGGGGLRFFPILDLGIGIDVNVVLGFSRSKDAPLAPAPASKSGKFLLGMEILPLVVEYRF